MIKSKIGVLTGREKTDVTDADMTMTESCSLLLKTRTVVGERERNLMWHERE
jgi:hypothetical protein